MTVRRETCRRIVGLIRELTAEYHEANERAQSTLRQLQSAEEELREAERERSEVLRNTPAPVGMEHAIGRSVSAIDAIARARKLGMLNDRIVSL